uniref:Uncharacterized protein n=1 Tax=Rhizophora mucronata TaxID=61149 RepID=A0A2P2NJR1_RHIMU
MASSESPARQPKSPTGERKTSKENTPLPDLESGAPKSPRDGQKSLGAMPGVGSKSLGAIANLANLLPTGTVLMFEALVSTFANNGNCTFVHKIFTWLAVGFCSFLCLFSCFTDSFIGKNDGQLYYGIATRHGFRVFNDTDSTDDCGNEELNENDKKKYKLKCVDFLHAFLSVFVFLAFAFSGHGVEKCLFSNPGPDGNAFFKNFPLAVGVISSFLFTIFTSKRKGIGYACGAHR